MRTGPRHTRITLARRTWTWLVALATPVVVVAMACGGPNDGSAPLVPGDAGPSGSNAAKTPADGGLEGDPQVLDFLLLVSEGVMARAGIVDVKGTAPSVRAFASALAADHGARSAKLEDIARRKAIARTPSVTGRDIGDESTGSIEKLHRLAVGPTFDRNYLQEEIILHLKTMAVLERVVAPAAVDPELAVAVTDARDEAVRHREAAQTLLRAVRAEAGAPAPESSADASADSSSPPDAGFY